ncbi:beta-ketoacyl-ACP synthase III [Hippea alviniae]|uniref:beta-ketoacyl-ACP synthase III n=1 Tax=Hippea alviniae TaxID=1279027 RepID=UPI0003B4E431|nr:beta-ketoacyl-ACP synthase III [Hippea alviniae]
MNAKVIATGAYLPKKILTNFDLEKMVDTSDEWITQRTGIHIRHIAEDESASDLAAKAAFDILDNADVSASEIELIVLATVTPDMPLPATALFVQEKIGARNAFAFDINAACSGFMYALSVANAYIKAGMVKNALVIGSETLSKITDWTDRSTCVIFGDGAAGILLKATENEDEGILSMVLHSDGGYTDLMRVPAPGSRQPCSVEAIENRDIYIKMKGNETFKMAVRSIASVSKEALDLVGLGFSDVDWMVCHQANRRIIEGVAKRVDLDLDRAIITIDRHANTAAASIPLALDWAVKNGKIKEGDIVLLNSFGASLTWSAGVVRW